MQKHTPGMFLTEFRTRKYTGGIISQVDIFLTVTPVKTETVCWGTMLLGLYGLVKILWILLLPLGSFRGSYGS